jgi:hypothetical protein
MNALLAAAFFREEERLQTAPLVRHFFGRFFDNELVAAAADAHVSVTQILALLTVPGLFLAMYLMPQYTVFEFMPLIYREQALVVDRYLFVSLSMVIVGFATIIEWDALFPDRRDYSILLALPVSGRALFTAKILSLFGFLGLFSLAVNLWSQFLFPMVSIHRGASFPTILHWICAHIGAVLLASSWVFLFFLALQGVLLNVLPLRLFRRISPYLQFVSLAGLVSALLVFPNFAAILPQLVAGNHRGLLYYPPIWFLGLYQVWLGDTRPIFHELARIAFLALGCVTLLSALTYAVGYRGHARKFLESGESQSGAPSWMNKPLTSMLDKTWLRRQLERASFYFVWQALSRSRRHKLYLAAYAGVGTAFVFQGLTALASRENGFSAEVSPGLLSIQLNLSFFFLSGLRYAITIPAEPAANWIFRLTEDERRRFLLEGTRKFVLLAGIVPVCAALLPVHVMLWGWHVALLHLVFGAVLSVLLIEALLLGFHKIPFTCYYRPGRSNPTTLGVLYFAAFLTYTYSMTTLEYWILLKPVRLAGFLAVLAPVLTAMVWIRKNRIDDDFELIFEDAREPEIRTLGISLPRAVSSPPGASAVHPPLQRE